MKDNLLFGSPEEQELNDRFRRHRHILRINDTVTVHRRRIFNKNEAVDNTGDRNPDGKSGVIVGYSVKSVCRFNVFSGLKPGIYIDPEWAYVRVGDHEVRHINVSYLSLPNDVTLERLTADRITHPDIDVKRNGPFLCDLPESAIWEGDIVRLKPWPNQFTRPLTQKGRKEFNMSFPEHPDAHVVSWMSYRPDGGNNVVESLDNPPMFALSDRLYRHSGGRYYDFQMDLLERGNVWRQAHSEPLAFHDLHEEAIFAVRSGAAKKAKGVAIYEERQTGRTKVLKLIEAGEGDGIQYDEDFSYNGYDIYRFNDRDLGERVRRATLTEGFDIPSSDDPEG